MAEYPGLGLLCLDIAATQSLGQFAGDLADQGMAPPAVAIGKALEKRGGACSECHFEVQRKRMVIDSGHSGHENKNGTRGQSPRVTATMSAQRRSLSAERL